MGTAANLDHGFSPGLIRWSTEPTALGCCPVFQRKMDRMWTDLGTVRMKPKSQTGDQPSKALTSILNCFSGARENGLLIRGRPCLGVASLRVALRSESSLCWSLHFPQGCLQFVTEVPDLLCRGRIETRVGWRRQQGSFNFLQVQANLRHERGFLQVR